MPIMEQGYQHWSGDVSGHTWRWLAIARHGIRIQFRNRFLRYVLFAAWMPALILVGMLAIWGMLERKSNLVSTFVAFMRFMNPSVIADPRYYRVEIWRLSYGYFMHVELFFSLLIVLLVGPGLISQDLRVNALPLYFSRPLRRRDYFLGKLGVIGCFLAMVTILPTIIAYIVGILFSFKLYVAVQMFPILMGAIVFGLIICVCSGTLMLGLSALSRNSRYVALLWLGFWFVSSGVSGVLVHLHYQQLRSAYFAHQLQPVRPIPHAASPSAPGAPAYGVADINRHLRRISRRQYWRDFQLQRRKAARTDWRPTISFTADLSRVGAHLLGTNQAWRVLAKLEPDEWRRNRLLMRFAGPRYPWLWSAGALAGLLGISLCVLNLSIRSMDRPK